MKRIQLLDHFPSAMYAGCRVEGVVTNEGVEVVTYDYRSRYPSSLLLRAGAPVRITRKPAIWGMPDGKYCGTIEADKDGRIFDVTGQFYRIRVRKGPAYVGAVVYFAAKRLVLLPTKIPAMHVRVKP
jgi:hypothetical protein